MNCTVAAWTEGELELFYAPVLVCKAPTKTVGLGDAISTVGLVTQLYR
jgi:ADP-dependent phosphofructokinase/glucokinase